MIQARIDAPTPQGSMEPQKIALVVLGMHRSGTSAMARVLSLCGAALPSNMMRPAAANELGFWEPQDVANLNDKILRDLDSDWAAMFGPRRNRKGEVPARKYLEKARAVIRANWSDEPMIVVKEPRVSMLVDLWSEALRTEGYRPLYVIMVRHPAEVADSLKAKYGITRNQSLILWSTYMLAAETGTRNAPRLFLSFDDLLQNPEGMLDRLEIELDISLPRRSWLATAEIESFLKEDARHHKAKGRADLSGMPTIQRYYEYLQSACDGAVWNEDLSAELSSWISSLEQTVGPILAGMENHIRETQRELVAEREKSLQAQTLIAAAEQAHAERAAELSDKLTELRDNLSGLESALADEREKSEEAQARTAAADRALAERDAQLLALREELSVFESELAAEREKAEEAQARIAERERQLTELREGLSGLESELITERHKSKEVQTRLAAAERTLAGRDAELVTAGKNLRNLTARILAREADFAVSVSGAQRRLEDAEAKLAKLSSAALGKHAEAENMLVSVRTRLAEVEQKNLSHLQLMQKKTDEECGLREELYAALRMRSEDQRTIAKLTLSLSDSEKYIEALREQNAKSLQDVEQMARALSSAISRTQTRNANPIALLRQFIHKI